MLKPALTAALIFCSGIASASAVEPVYWRQRVFFIPYQAGTDSSAAQIDKVQLLVARDGVGEWAVLQEAQPHVRGFSYHAPVDGEYAFALRTSDRKGNLTPTSIAQPQLRVIVDTTAPSLQLSAILDATGRIIVRYEARDVQLKPESLRIEAQTGGAAWERLATGPPDVSQPDRVLGQLVWKPPSSAGDVQFRGTIDDRAGNQATAAARASLVGPLLSPAAGPSLSSAAGPAPPALMASNAPTSSRPPLDWPASNAAAATTPSGSPPASQAASPAPPLWPQERTPAQLVADAGAPPRSIGDRLAATSNPFSPPPLFAAPSPPPAAGPEVVQGANPGWTSAGANDSPATSVRWVNSLTFDVDYDLQTVGPWGVSKVEMWATRDGGREWVSFGADPDNRGPMRVAVPTAGVYGFRLVVSGANGAAAPNPASGDQPELVIGVDLQAPQADLQAAEVGQGNLADHLLIRWTAADENLEARPVALFYGTEAEGPWSTIATDVDNNGQYAWRLLRQVPEKLFLRLEVRDKAGNIAVRQSPAPVVLNLPQPSGRLRSVRPVQEDPSRFRTAAGPTPSPPAQ